jgi:hypothetical protein
MGWARCGAWAGQGVVHGLGEDCIALMGQGIASHRIGWPRAALVACARFPRTIIALSEVVHRARPTSSQLGERCRCRAAPRRLKKDR